MSPLISYVITAARTGEPPKQLRLYAHDRAHAIQSAQELFPGHLFSVPTQEPDWHDDAS